MKPASLLWKIPLALLALPVGSFSASQFGWSGAEFLLNGGLVEGAVFLISASVCFGVFLLMKQLAKPVLWVIVPLCLYSALVKGVWDGIYSDFDAKRGEAIQHRWADARVLAQMSEKGKRLSCQDGRIELADDAKAKCSEILIPNAGATGGR